MDPIQNVHHTHIWSLDGEHHVITTHVVVPPETSREAAGNLKRQIARQIKSEDFEHMTIEIEFGEHDCRLTPGHMDKSKENKNGHPTPTND